MKDKQSPVTNTKANVPEEKEEQKQVVKHTVVTDIVAPEKKDSIKNDYDILRQQIDEVKKAVEALEKALDTLEREKAAK